MVVPELATAPVIFPVIVPIVQLKVEETDEVKPIDKKLLLQIVSVLKVLTIAGFGNCVTVTG